MDEKEKISQRGISAIFTQQQYAGIKRDLFGGMLKEAGLSEEEIDNTLKNDVTDAATEDLQYTPEDLKELESEEYKQWEAEQKAVEERRNKRLNSR